MFKKIHHSRVKQLCEDLGKIYEDEFRFVFEKDIRKVFVTTYTKIGDEWADGSISKRQTKDEFLTEWATTIILDVEYYGYAYLKGIEYKVLKAFVGEERVYTTPIHEYLAKKNNITLSIERDYEILHGA